MRVVLQIDDPNIERKVAVTRSEATIGRAPECDLVLPDRSVSRAHAMIVLSASGATIRDLGSRNGTWVNGLRLGSDRRLRPGDRVRLGCASLVVAEIVHDEVDRDDGWLAIQCALILKESGSQRFREADEILFKLAEALEARVALGERFGDDVVDAALSAVIDYAGARKRPGWVRWAMGIHAKLGVAPGPAVRRALENTGAESELRASGSIPRAPVAATIVPDHRRRVG